MKYCLKHTLNTKYKTKKKWHPTITRHFLAPLSACPQGAAELLCRWSLSGATLTPPSSTHSAAGTNLNSIAHSTVFLALQAPAMDSVYSSIQPSTTLQRSVF